MSYSIHFAGSRSSIQSADIIAMLDAANPVHAAHIEAIERIEDRGISYAHEDYDVLSAAYDAARKAAS